MQQVISIYSVKALRVFSFGMVSIMTPVYLSILGYSPFFVGLALAAVVSGNIISNILLTWFDSRIGTARIILAFSLLMFMSGLIFFLEDNPAAIILASLIGNISVTGTEAGPFQSVETAIIPNYVGESKSGRAYGLYNVIGYVASSIGAFFSSLPSYLGNSLLSFRILYLFYGFVGLFMLAVYSNLNLSGKAKREKGMSRIDERARKDITALSVLYFTDALGGGFVTQSLLSFWFYFVYHVSLGSLGVLFLAANIITAVSTFIAPLIAEHIGNLRTMVYTHLLSNAFLLAIPFTGSLAASIFFLFLRQSVSQMDVPTRQAFMINIFDKEQRVVANAVTNTSRSIANLFGAPLTGFLLSIGFVSLPIIAGAFIKIIYDFGVYSVYRKRSK